MLFKQLPTKEYSLSYFFGCGTKGKFMAVDVVAGDEEWYIEEARKAGVSINFLIDTHVHADHYSGGRKLAQMVGAPYCLHESDKGWVKFEFEFLTGGQWLFRFVAISMFLSESVLWLFGEETHPRINPAGVLLNEGASS